MSRIAALSLLLAAPLAASERYINPLPVPDYPVQASGAKGGPDFRSMADPTVIRYEDKWYLFPSNGMAWVSEDFVHWKYHRVEVPGIRGIFWAPTVVAYKGEFLLTGNGAGLYHAPHPLGPYTLLGRFVDHNGKPYSPFDAMIFVDDDQRIYFYYAGGSTKGIYGVELDPKSLTHFLTAPVHFFSYNPEHVWERKGDFHELINQSWIEGPWMTKRKGRYYLQYSAPGTEYKTYAVGLYTASHPLGPFTYDAASPILKDRGGLLNGSAHHSVVEGPDGTLWMFYHVLYRNHDRFERRLAMDPVGFDAAGRMFVNGPTETPQWAPGVKPEPWRDNDAGALPLSVNKPVTASSAAPGRDPVYAVDQSVRTWWEAAAGDRQPWLTVDLLDEFSVDSVRILYSGGHLSAVVGRTPAPVPYRIEVSLDGKQYRTIVDKTANAVDNDIEFDSFAPTCARWVRITFTGAPRSVPVGMLEFTVFGK